MAELFNDPTLWQDDLGNTPPRQWDGSKYHFLVGAVLTYKGTAQVGDTVTFDAAWTSSGATVVTIADGSGAIATVAEGASQPAHVSATINNPSTVTITTSDDPDTYSCDITLTPTVAAEVARVVELRYSKDGAHNWSKWREQDMGDQGNFNKKVRFRRLGFGERIVLHVRVSADVGRDLIAASVDTEAF